MDEQLIFQVTKLIAESDSICEGYSYCEEFTERLYEIEKGGATQEFMGEMREIEPVGWRDLAIEIIQLVESSHKGE
jgi:hypothetical protein